MGDGSLHRVGRSHLQRGHRTDGCVVLVDGPGRDRAGPVAGRDVVRQVPQFNGRLRKQFPKNLIGARSFALGHQCVGTAGSSPGQVVPTGVPL